MGTAMHRDLVKIAEAMRADYAALGDCWDLLVDGLSDPSLDPAALRTMSERLSGGRGYGVQEFMCEVSGDTVEVTLLDESARCRLPLFLDRLRTLLQRFEIDTGSYDE